MSFFLLEWNCRHIYFLEFSTTFQRYILKIDQETFSFQTKLKFQLLLWFFKITLSGSIFPLINSCFQNCNACSNVKPMPFRKRPYCIRPPWRRWWFSRKALCNWRMQGGKDLVESYKRKEFFVMWKIYQVAHIICCKSNLICKL